jgi:PAS domain S-box-containing protein
MCADRAPARSTEDGLLSFALDGTVQNWSRGAEFLYGYSETEIAGQPLGRLLPFNEAPKFDGLLHAAIRGEFPQYENAKRIRKDGSSMVVGISRAPIRNEQGEIVGIVESGRALTMNSVENRSEGQLKQTIEQIPMALWTTDLNLRLTLCLGAGLRGAKNRNEELLVKSVHEYLKCHDPHTTPVAQHYDALEE